MVCTMFGSIWAFVMDMAHLLFDFKAKWIKSSWACYWAKPVNRVLNIWILMGPQIFYDVF